MSNQRSKQQRVLTCQRCGRGFMFTAAYGDFLAGPEALNVELLGE